MGNNKGTIMSNGDGQGDSYHVRVESSDSPSDYQPGHIYAFKAETAKGMTVFQLVSFTTEDGTISISGALVNPTGYIVGEDGVSQITPKYLNGASNLITCGTTLSGSTCENKTGDPTREDDAITYPPSDSTYYQFSVDYANGTVDTNSITEVDLDSYPNEGEPCS